MPISAANLSNQDLGFNLNLNGRVWRWKTRMDVSGLTPTFQIIDILTPYGVFRDAVPLPGEVVQAMSDSIASLLANFQPSILLGPPSSLVFTVDEGRGYSQPLSGRLTNNGVFGSLLSGTLMPSAPYIHISPEVIGHLASNQYGLFDVSVDSTDLLASSSPYAASITVQDTSASNSPQTLPVVINVRPLAIVAATPTPLNFAVIRPVSGPFPAIPTQTFNAENTGPADSYLEYQITRLTGLSQNWLAGFSPTYGALTSGTQQAITVTVTPVEGLLPGVYEETLRVSGYSFNSYADVLVRLTIT